MPPPGIVRRDTQDDAAEERQMLASLAGLPQDLEGFCDADQKTDDAAGRRGSTAFQQLPQIAHRR